MYKLKILFSRFIIFTLYGIIIIFSLIPKKRKKSKGNVIVLTGTFYSKNWLDAHLVPIVTCPSVKHVYIVSSNLDYNISGLSVVVPNEKMSKYFGSTISRLISFFICSIKRTPDYIGGFHILFNATFSILFANMLRCRSIYFSVGGITETLEAGKTENKFFEFLNAKDDFLTNYICKIARNATSVITMGNGAKKFLYQHGVSERNIHVISGAIDSKKFYPASQEQLKKYDMVLTARLSKVKQVNIFLDVVHNIKSRNVDCKALIIGEGPLLSELQQYAKALDIEKQVTFAGHQSDVLTWLHQSKIYVLTSRSEGLALSMLEGLKAGLPAVVPNVGDLSDVLSDGYNGYLIENHSISDFSDKIIALINDEHLLHEYSSNAIKSTKRFDLSCVQMQWQKVFSEGS
jgi:glycosyltransferase involved in cell wall biosynthesis